MARRWRPATRAEIMRYLEETYPESSSLEKLHALISWARHDKGGDLESIAVRARISLRRVRQILSGEIRNSQWDAIEEILKACGAEQAMLSVALDLYAQIGATRSRTDPYRVGLSEEFDPTRLMLRLTDLPTSRADPHITMTEVTDLEPPKPENEMGKETEKDASDEGSSSKPPLTPSDPVEVLRPDPTRARTAKEFVEEMLRFWTVMGKPSLRMMAKACAESRLVQTYSFASFSNIKKMGKESKLPKKTLVLAYIVGCGGDRQDLDSWSAAWTELALLIENSTADGQDD